LELVVSKLYKPARPIEVVADESGKPVAVRWRGAIYRGETTDHWRIQTGWWEEEVSRDYYLLDAKDLVCEVYRDRLQDGWYMHRVYD
jgi:hypothetical protein